MSKYISVTDTAKLVRKALKANFPKTVFSVKSKSYSGGASITVSWTDGETTGQVEPIIKQFEGATFDGMIDLKSYHDSVLEGDEVVHFGADYVFANRETSISFRMRIAKVVCAYFDLTVPQMNRYNWFDLNEFTTVKPTGGHDNLIDLFNQVLSVTNANDETLHPRSHNYIPTWIERVWEAAHNSSAEVILNDFEARLAAEFEAEPEAVDETPCVKVSPLTLEPVVKPDALRERLHAVNIDNLSPLEALTLLYELKRIS